LKNFSDVRIITLQVMMTFQKQFFCLLKNQMKMSFRIFASWFWMNSTENWFLISNVWRRESVFFVLKFVKQSVTTFIRFDLEEVSLITNEGRNVLGSSLQLAAWDWLVVGARTVHAMEIVGGSFIFIFIVSFFFSFIYILTAFHC